MRNHSYILALAFVVALLLLVAGRPALARDTTPPDTGELLLEEGSADAGPAGFSGLIMTTTVGVGTSGCAATTAITVPAGTPVTFCYRLLNDSGFSLLTHNLRDVLAEGILNDQNLPMPQGASTTYTRTIVATSTVLNLAVWSVTQPITGYTIATGNCTTFPDISGSGQALALEDDGLANVTIPFYFPLYDRFSNRLRVSNNGAALLDEPNFGVSFVNANLPSSGLPHGLALFWDDLDIETGQVYVGMKTFTAAELLNADGTPSALMPPGVNVAELDPQIAFDYYVVEYLQRSIFPGPSNTGTFAMALHMTGEGADGLVVMCYQDTDFADVDHTAAHNFGASATIGLNHNGSVADEYSFDTSQPTLTGTAALTFTPIGGNHPAFVSSASAKLNVVTTINVPIVHR